MLLFFVRCLAMSKAFFKIKFLADKVERQYLDGPIPPS